MTRPRAYQIDNPQVNYVEFEIPQSAPLSSPELTLSGTDYASFLTASITHQLGGAIEDCPAVITSLAGPFSDIMDTHWLTIAISDVNSGNPVKVVFSTSDFVTIDGVFPRLTAAKAADRINAFFASYGVSPASDHNGCLRITSGASVGLSAFVTVASGTAGILQHLRFSTGYDTVTVHGVSLKRGVITQSMDGLGGYFPLRYRGGGTVLTAPAFWYHAPGPFGAADIFPDMLGGLPIYGRLDSAAVSSVRLSFFARTVAPPRIVGHGGDFALLDGTDALTIHVECGTVSGSCSIASFAGVTSVADAVNIINTKWHAAGFGSPKVTSSVPEPYQLDGTDYLNLTVDGVTRTVNFAAYAGRATAQSVADAINIAFSSTVAEAVSIDGKKYLQIESATNTSSSKVSVDTNNTAHTATLMKLGLTMGEIRRSDICRVSGTTEIEFLSPFWDPSLQTMAMSYLDLQVDSGDPCTKMGVHAGETYGEMREVPVIPPDLESNCFQLAPMLMLIPECLEMGDVPSIESAVLQQFAEHDGSPRITGVGDVRDAYKPAMLDRRGLLPSELMDAHVPSMSFDSIVVGASKAYPYAARVSVPFAHNTAPTPMRTLLCESIAVPTTTVPVAPALRQYASEDNIGVSSVSTVNARWNASTLKWTKDVDSAAACIEFGNDGTWSLQYRSAGDPDDWNTFTPMVNVFPENSESGPTLQLAPGGWFSNSDTLAFSDANISNGADYLALSETLGANGAEFPRVADKYASQIPHYSLLRAVNGRYHVTVGNGTTTFGDFNGANGLIDAITFLSTLPAIGTRRVTIHLKAGYYNTGSGISITTSSGICDLEIIGPPGGDNVTSSGTYGRCTIGQPNIDANTITFTRSGTNSGSLTLKNVMVEVAESSGTYYYGVEVVGGAHLFMENCQVQCVSINNPVAHTDNSKVKRVAVQARHCRFLGSVDTGGNGPLTFQNVAAAPETFVFEHCTFTYGTFEQRCVYIKASSGISGVVHMGPIRFFDCRFILGAGYVSAGNLTKNTGVIDLDPNGQDVRASDGLIVDDVLFEDCRMEATYSGSGSGYSNVLLHLLPTANGTDADVSGAFMYIDHLQFRDCSFSHSARPATAFNAFTCAGARRVTIERCKYKIESPSIAGIHGKQTTDCQHMFTGAAVSDANWASLAIAADDIVIHDLECTGFLHKSTSGDILLRYNDAIDVDGIQCSQYSLTPNTGSAPSYRIATVYGENTSPFTGIGTVHTGMIAGIKLHGVQATNTGSWCLYAFILGALENTEITRAQVTGFRTSNGQTVAQSCVGLIELAGLCGDSDNFKITNCLFTDMKGIDVFATYLWNGTISGNEIVDSGYEGMNVSITWVMGCLNILNNSVRGCNGVGIAVWYDNTDGPMRVSNNTCLYNDTALNNNQISIRPNSGINVEPVVVAYGNNCYSMDVGSAGYIRVSRRVTNHEVALPTPVSRNNGSGSGAYFGCETGNATTTTFAYTDAALMLHNMAYLHSG